MLGEYARSQLAPGASLASDLWFKADWQNRPLPNSERPVPRRLRAQGIEPYTWPEFWTEQLLPIPAQEGAKEVWRDGMHMGPQQVKSAASIMLMSVTGGRITEDLEAKK